MSKTEKRIDDLVRHLNYVLGRRPDEFGLVPDENGFFSIKEVIQSFSKEIRPITYNDINELILKGAGIEVIENKIRVKEIYFSFEPCDISNMPKILYTFVRQKAHPVVLEKGIREGIKMIPLFSNKDFAQKVGRLRIGEPIILEIDSKRLIEKGTKPLMLGELFLVHSIPKEAITGPPIKAIEEKPKKPPKKPEPPEKPGSYLLKTPPPTRPQKPPKGRKPKGWKEGIRKFRRDQ
jgi:putative RNA 2'-phosphotransferase